MEKELKQQPSQTPGEPAEEKLEFLKREEVRTMAKDIAAVRKKEAKKEREHIANLQKEAQLPKKPQVVLSQHPETKPKAIESDPIGTPPTAVGLDSTGAKQFAQETPKRPLLPGRPLKRSEKLFIRLVVGSIIVFLIFNAVAFGFWYFFKRGAQKQPESQNIQQELQIPPAPGAPGPECYCE